MEPDGWRVVGQNPTERYDGRNFERGVEVFIVTDTNTRHTLWIPESHYNREYVTAAGNAFAERDREIAALGNPQ